jgi:hypothetical protein
MGAELRNVRMDGPIEDDASFLHSELTSLASQRLSISPLVFLVLGPGRC